MWRNCRISGQTSESSSVRLSRAGCPALALRAAKPAAGGEFTGCYPPDTKKAPERPFRCLKKEEDVRGEAEYSASPDTVLSAAGRESWPAENYRPR